MATMISGVATGGIVPVPRLSRMEAPRHTRVEISPATFDVIRSALREAVRSGTGRESELRTVNVAGKTGTAQVFKHSAGVDSDDLPKQERDHAWFVGYAPADDPDDRFRRRDRARRSRRSYGGARRPPRAGGPFRRGADEARGRGAACRSTADSIVSTSRCWGPRWRWCCSARWPSPRPRWRVPGNEGLWRTQLVWVLLALAGATVVAAVDYRLWAATALALHAGVMVLLGVVLFFGREVGGNRSWLDFGAVRVQPSELAKLTTCLVLAHYLTRGARESLGLRQLAGIAVLTGLPVVLIALQPDMGTAVIFVPIFLAALLMGRCALAGDRDRDRHRPAARARDVVHPAGLPEGTHLHRVRSGTRPDRIRLSGSAVEDRHRLRWTDGQGSVPGDPEPAQFPAGSAHGLRILSVLAEELGFIGVIGVLALFYLRCSTGASSPRCRPRIGWAPTSRMLVVAWIAGQMAVNVGMVLGRLPTIGVPLAADLLRRFVPGRDARRDRADRQRREPGGSSTDLDGSGGRRRMLVSASIPGVEEGRWARSVERGDAWLDEILPRRPAAGTLHRR